MLNESVKQVNVMTEEELNGKEKSFYQLCHYGTMSEATRDQAIEVIASHRTLNSRNAKLVHENDELMAENEKLKKILEGLNHE